MIADIQIKIPNKNLLITKIGNFVSSWMITNETALKK